MRCLLKLQMDTEAGSRAIQDGSLSATMQDLIERIQPEATYFGTDDGNRTAFIFFDMQDPSDMPRIAEPAFSKLKARVSLTPIMNGEDLEKGLAQLQ
ncbi:MAG: hypothetical protein ACRDPH_12280 [Marmoricola sp.]